MSKQGERNAQRARNRKLGAAGGYRGEQFNAYGISYDRVDAEPATLGLRHAHERGFRAQIITEANMISACDGSAYQRARIEAFRP